MSHQYQRGPDGNSIPASNYPPIPTASLFFDGWGYQIPKTVHYWCWRTDYNTWGACVTFSNGKRMVTNPKRADLEFK